MDKIRLGIFHSCAWTVRLICMALATLLPWFYGGAQWQAQRALVWATIPVAILSIAAILASPRRSGRFGHLTFFLMALVLLGSIQTFPLPSWCASQLGSYQAIADAKEIASQDLENNNGRTFDILGVPVQWTISVCSPRSRAALAVLASATIVFWASSMFFTSRRWAMALVVAIAINGLANAFLGIVQRVAWNNWSLLEFPHGNYYSTFVSRNSAADLFLCALGAMLVLLSVTYQNRKRSRRKEFQLTYPGSSMLGKIRNRLEDIFINMDSWSVACLLGSLFLSFSLLATYSRGGAVAALGGCVATIILTLGTTERTVRSLLTVGCLIAVAIAMLAFYDLDETLFQRFDQLNEVAYERRDGRLTVWGYTISALGWYWLLGSGICTYQFALLPFHDGGPDVWFQHAENLYLEIFVEFGGLGLICAIAGIAKLVRDLFREASRKREDFLLPGAAFVVFAVLLHSLIDFSLILPGVFLPMAMIVGAFDGRTRRADAEERFREANPVPEDARERYKRGISKSPVDRPLNTRLTALNLSVAIVCLLVQWRGLHDLAAYTQAEMLQSQLVKLEKQAVSSRLNSDQVNSLRVTADELAHQYPNHNEAQLAAGRVNLLALRMHVLELLDSYADMEYAEQWNFSRPEATLLVLGMEKPEAKAIQQTIASSVTRRDLLQRSQECFAAALGSCPLDGRAAWGCYLSGLGQASTDHEELAGSFMMLLNRNNPNVLYKAGLAAVAFYSKDGPERDLGLRLLQLSIALQSSVSDRLVATALPHISAKEARALLPEDDTASLCKAAQTFVGISAEGEELSRELLKALYPQLKNATSTDRAGWRAMAWAARQNDDFALAILFMNRTLVSGRSDIDDRIALARLHYESGERAEAMRQLEVLSDKYPQNRAKIEQTKNEWTRSVDQVQ